MRKYSSSIKTAFLSEAGSEISNNDYFAFVELEDHACYVIADGLSNLREQEGARQAIHTVIQSFQENPSVAKRALKSYLSAANRELTGSKGYEKQQASIIVIVSDYEVLRFAYAGNARLRFYRDGHRLHATADMSLSQELVDREALPLDALARHEERNNLTNYLGKENFVPHISEKIKLKDGDIITLATRGIWENILEGDLDEIMRGAGTEPGECCDQVEELLVSEATRQVENYTFAAIFIEKAYEDPDRKKKIKKIILLSILAAVIILAVGIIFYFVRRSRERTREEIDLGYGEMLEYIEDGNYVRAAEECEETIVLAQKLYDKEARERLLEYQKFLEAMNSAAALFEEGKYIEAEDAYLSAKARSRQADNIALEEIEIKLGQINRYRDVYDNIALGDRLMEEEEYELAEEKYLTAKKDAAFVYFENGKQQATEALDKLYEEWGAARDEAAAAAEKEEQEREEKAAENASDQAAAAEIMAQGDRAYMDGDFDGAMVFYLIALEKYSKLEDTAQITKLNKKIIELNDKQAAVEEREADAKLFQEEARMSMEEGDYEKAKEQYQYAQDIYRELGQDNRADEMQSRMDLTDTKSKQQEKENAANAADGSGGAGNSVSGNEVN